VWITKGVPPDILDKHSVCNFLLHFIFDALVVEVVKRSQVQLLVGEWSLTTLTICSHYCVPLSSIKPYNLMLVNDSDAVPLGR